ncbi:MAG: TIGR03619 family F420-dependent LLM class oxidoreductase, partial [Chloroflexi bacterium]|nr:TIGR03619 family F420-dependent LLM class oxidoreductase [Chloroflexota bacterium]
MRFGIAVPTYLHHAQRDSIVNAALRAEALGYDSIWVPDHQVTGEPFLSRMGPHWFEPFVTLSYLAAMTSRIKLGLAVLVVPYRHPVFTAKLVSTLDQLSGGRLILGVGSGGDVEIEFKALGVPWRARGAVTDEYLVALKAMWSGKFMGFDGKHCQIPKVNINPLPRQRTHPPLWVGGNSRVARRRAAQHCDGWHPLRLTPPQLKAAIDDLRALTKRYGRKERLTVSLQSEFIRITDKPLGKDRLTHNGSVQQIADDLRAYRHAGLDHIAQRFA